MTTLRTELEDIAHRLQFGLAPSECAALRGRLLRAAVRVGMVENSAVPAVAAEMRLGAHQLAGRIESGMMSLAADMRADMRELPIYLLAWADKIDPDRAPQLPEPVVNLASVRQARQPIPVGVVGDVWR